MGARWARHGLTGPGLSPGASQHGRATRSGHKGSLQLAGAPSLSLSSRQTTSHGHCSLKKKANSDIHMHASIQLYKHFMYILSL
jgi:hypothetical protein